MAAMSPSSTVLTRDTNVTTDELRREIGSLRELMETRLDAMDRAVELFTENLVRVPTDTDKQVNHLREYILSQIETLAQVNEEKFRGIKDQFTQRDVALAAALQAAKEAVGQQNEANATASGKAEAATTKQIDALVAAIATASKVSEDKINDVKDRLGEILSASSQRTGHDSGTKDSWGLIFGLAAVAVAVIEGVALLFRSGAHP